MGHFKVVVVLLRALVYTFNGASMQGFSTKLGIQRRRIALS